MTFVAQTRRCFRHADSGHGKLVSVRITVLGCSGSVVGPDSPASGYLLTAPDTPPLVIDFGGGVLGALQRHADPNAVHVLLSHLHADHCLDLPGLFVWRRYHPSPAPERGLMYGPQQHVGAAGRGVVAGGRRDRRLHRHLRHPALGRQPGRADRFADRRAAAGVPSDRVLRDADHRSVRRDVRLQRRHRRTATRSIDLARGADVFLCEASWTHDRRRGRRSCICRAPRPGQAAARAGVAELLLTHIPPWTSREDVISEAKAEFDGPVHAVVCGESVRRHAAS